MRNIPISCLLLCLFALFSCQNGGDISNGQKQDNDTTRLRLEMFNQAIDADINNPDLYNKRAKFYLLDHQFDNALKDVRRAISIDDTKSASYITLSDIYLLMGKPEESRDALIKAISKNPRDICFHHIINLNISILIKLYTKRLR